MIGQEERISQNFTADDLNTVVLETMMTLAGADLKDVGEALGCSYATIHYTVKDPQGKKVKDPQVRITKALQIYELLVEWIKPTGMAIVKVA